MVDEFILSQDEVTDCIFEMSFHLDTLHKLVNAVSKRIANQTIINLLSLIYQFDILFRQNLWNQLMNSFGLYYLPRFI